MAEIESFEARLAAALDRLADDPPTEVDAAELTRTIAAADAQRGWLRPLVGAWPGGGLWPGSELRLARVLQLVLAAAAVLALTVGLLVLAQRTAPAAFDGLLIGRVACAGTSWTASTNGSVVLECSSELPDPRASGTVRIDIGAATSVQGALVRSGSVELQVVGGRWTGTIQVTSGTNGVAVGDATLVGEGDLAGLILRLHLTSDDGLRWGVIGSMSTSE